MSQQLLKAVDSLRSDGNIMYPDLFFDTYFTEYHLV